MSLSSNKTARLTRLQIMPLQFLKTKVNITNAKPARDRIGYQLLINNINDQIKRLYASQQLLVNISTMTFYLVLDNDN